MRELQNLIERALVLGRGGLGPGFAVGAPRPAPAPAPRAAASERPQVLTSSELQELERQNLLNALERSSFRIAGDAGAARLVGMSPSTFAYRMKQLGIQRPRAS